jgi:hypothetical protein
MANNIQIAAFWGMVLVDVVVFTGILLPVSIAEIITQEDLGTYYVAKKMGDFTVQLGTDD